MFTLVGGLGVFVPHAGARPLPIAGLDVAFLTSQLAATTAAMTFNFFANNLLT